MRNAVKVSTRPTIALLFLLTACFSSDDERLNLVELDCQGSECAARWEASEEWSRVWPTSEVEALPAADIPAQWGCEPDPDVDICAEIDTHGRVGCFRVESAWAVAAAPECASPGTGHPIGLGMAAATLAR